MKISISLRDSDGLNLSGIEPITVNVEPSPIRVEVFVEVGLNKSTKPMFIGSSAPYIYNFNTTTVADGTYIIRAEGVYKSRRSRTTITVSVKNAGSPPPSSDPSGYGQGLYGMGNYGE